MRNIGRMEIGKVGFKWSKNLLEILFDIER